MVFVRGAIGFSTSILPHAVIAMSEYGVAGVYGFFAGRLAGSLIRVFFNKGAC